MLRLLNKTFPSPLSASVLLSPLQYAMGRYGDSGLVEYLRLKRYPVVKALEPSDKEIKEYLEQRGYEVEGLLGDVYYSTKEKMLLRVTKSAS
jgi:hypothetical protein